MPVLINEFEVIDAAPPPAMAAPSAAATPSAPALPDPRDLQRLLAQQAERQLRLWSH